MFFTPLRTPPPPGIYTPLIILAIFLLLKAFGILWGWGWVGGPPRNVEWVTSRTGTSPHRNMLSRLRIHWCRLFIFTTMDTRLESILRGGGKCPDEEHSTWSGGPVVGGHDASAESASRQRNSHTLIFFHNSHFSQIITSLSTLTHTNKFIFILSKNHQKIC
jgi:hypothetical protein